MPVYYDEQEIRPIQSVDFTTDKQTLGDGRPINSVVRATVKGTIVPDDLAGTFTPLPSDQKLSAILARQKEIREIFAVDGKVFEVQGWDASQPAKFQAHVVSVDFGEGPWYNRCDYTVVLESSLFSGETDTAYFVESASENWSFEEDDQPKTTRVTHTVNAKGRTVYDPDGGIPVPAWKQAQIFVADQLALGWDSVGGMSPVAGVTLAAESAREPLSTTAWNRVLNEEVNETEGTYSVTETFLLSANPYFEDYTSTVRKVDDQPNLVVEVTVQGTIHGFYTDLNDYDTRAANAATAWASVKTQLLTRAQDASGVTLNAHPSQYQVDEDTTQGTVSYQIGFNNRVLVNDTFETYTVSKKRAVTDYYTTVTVEGTVTGILYMDTDSDPSVRFTRAQNQWATVQPLLLARAVSVSGITGLQPYPADAQVSENPSLGTVSYSYQFDNRPLLTVRFEHSVTRKASNDDARTTVVVEGTITGLMGETSADPFAPSDPDERVNNALAYWNGIEPGLLGLAASYVDTTDQFLEAWSKSSSVNELAGTVSFSYEFTSKIRCFPFALSEVLQVSNEAPVKVVAELPIPGRAAGPIGQDMGTVTVRKRTFNVELILPLPKTCGYYDPPAVDPSPYAPSGGTVYLTGDSDNWQWTQGHYSRTVTWSVFN